MARVVLWVAFMVRTFAFHAGVASIVAGAMAVVMLRRRRWGPIALALASVALAWPEVRMVWPRDGATASVASTGGVGGSTSASSETLRVMSMNLLFLNSDASEVLREIEAADPDVVLLQEYHADWDLALAGPLLVKYEYACRPLREGRFGQAVYSKRRFVGEPMLDRLTRLDYCPQVGVKVEVGGKVLEVWNIHLMSPSGPGEIAVQWEQVGALLRRLSAREGATVLMGDFNSTTLSWTAGALRGAGLAEAHATVGRGRGATWPELPVVRFLPGVRIDQAWGSDEIEWVSSRVGGRTGSDHLPTVVELRVR